MRRDIFLHFLNRDSREIYGLFDRTRSAHRQALKVALNASVILCENYCIMPPGFAVECELAQSVLEEQSLLLSEQIICLPMRESNLGDFSEKKRQEYAPYRERYSGLFDEKGLRFLEANASGLIDRKVKVGEQISAGWIAGPDSKSPFWKEIRQNVEVDRIDRIRNVPSQLVDRGLATVWPAIRREIPPIDEIDQHNLRRFLQNIYFRTYITEFRLVVMKNIPWMLDTFGLESRQLAYDFRVLYRYLSVYVIADLLLNAPAETVILLRRNPSFIYFFDAYYSLSEISGGVADLEYAAGRAVEASGFDWAKFARSVHQTPNRVRALSDSECFELCAAMEAAAGYLVKEYSLPVRGGKKKAGLPSRKLILPGEDLFSRGVAQVNFNINAHNIGVVSSGVVNAQEINAIRQADIPENVRTVLEKAMIVALHGLTDEKSAAAGQVLVKEAVKSPSRFSLKKVIGWAKGLKAGVQFASESGEAIESLIHELDEVMDAVTG